MTDIVARPFQFDSAATSTSVAAGIALFPTSGPVGQESLIGRVAEVQTLVEALSCHENRVLTGGAKTGKTSTALAVIAALEDAGWNSITIDLFRSPDLSTAISQLVDSNASPSGRPLPPGATALAAALLELDATAKSTSTPTVVVLDCFHQVLTTQLFGKPDEVLSSLRAAFKRTHNIACLLVGSVPSVMRGICSSKDQPLYGSAQLHGLASISEAEWHTGLSHRFELGGCQIKPDAVDRLLAHSSGHPRVTMLVAQHTYVEARRNGAATIDEAAVDLGCEAALVSDLGVAENELDHVRRLGKHALAITLRVAQGESPYKDLAPAIARQTLRALETSGVVEHPKSGAWEIANPLFHQYLIRATGATPAAPVAALRPAPNQVVVTPPEPDAEVVVVQPDPEPEPTIEEPVVEEPIAETIPEPEPEPEPEPVAEVAEVAEVVIVPEPEPEVVSVEAVVAEVGVVAAVPQPEPLVEAVVIEELVAEEVAEVGAEPEPEPEPEPEAETLEAEPVAEIIPEPEPAPVVEQHAVVVSANGNGAAHAAPIEPSPPIPLNRLHIRHPDPGEGKAVAEAASRALLAAHGTLGGREQGQIELAARRLRRYVENTISHRAHLYWHVESGNRPVGGVVVYPARARGMYERPPGVSPLTLFAILAWSMALAVVGLVVLVSKESWNWGAYSGLLFAGFIGCVIEAAILSRTVIGRARAAWTAKRRKGMVLEGMWAEPGQMDPVFRTVATRLCHQLLIGHADTKEWLKSLQDVGFERERGSRVVGILDPNGELPVRPTSSPPAPMPVTPSKPRPAQTVKVVKADSEPNHHVPAPHKKPVHNRHPHPHGKTTSKQKRGTKR